MLSSAGVARYIMQQMLPTWVAGGWSTSRIISRLRGMVETETGVATVYRRMDMLSDIREARGIESVKDAWQYVRKDYLPSERLFVPIRKGPVRQYMYEIRFRGLDKASGEYIDELRVYHTDEIVSVDEASQRFLAEDDREQRYAWTDVAWDSFTLSRLLQRV